MKVTRMGDSRGRYFGSIRARISQPAEAIPTRMRKKNVRPVTKGKTRAGFTKSGTASVKKSAESTRIRKNRIIRVDSSVFRGGGVLQLSVSSVLTKSELRKRSLYLRIEENRLVHNPQEGSLGRSLNAHLGDPREGTRRGLIPPCPVMGPPPRGDLFSIRGVIFSS